MMRSGAGLVPTEKECSACGLVKAMAHFANHGFALDGKQSVCRWCMKVRYWKARGIVGDFPMSPPQECDLCGRRTSKLNMDHCHRTMHFRGFICPGCNTGIGSLGDTAESVRKAVEYLERAEANIGAYTTEDAL
jgi:hypothetical protein